MLYLYQPIVRVLHDKSRTTRTSRHGKRKTEATGKFDKFVWSLELLFDESVWRSSTNKIVKQICSFTAGAFIVDVE